MPETARFAVCFCLPHKSLCPAYAHLVDRFHLGRNTDYCTGIMQHGPTRKHPATIRTTASHELPAVTDTQVPPLFRLPPELRLIIYEHVLLPFPPSEARIFAAPPLLRVCRLIRSEAFDTAATILTNAITEARAERDVLNSRYPPGPIFCGVGMRASAIEDYRRLAKVKAWVRVLERLAWCLGFEVPEQGTEGHEVSFPASSRDCE